MTDLPDSTRWQLWIVAFGFFMQSLDTTIVNTALPSMAQSLGESPLHMHMVIVSYVLTVALLLFVGIPLPGTGAWTGTLAASILDMKFKDVLVACMGGMLLAGIIMGLASAGLLGALSTLFSVG